MAKPYDSSEDQRLLVKRPVPKNKLSEEETQTIIETVNQTKFSSLPPSQIIPIGIYLASESTFYLVLRLSNMQHHRGWSQKPSKKPKATHCATGPNQVWMWDGILVHRSILSEHLADCVHRRSQFLIGNLETRLLIFWRK